MARPDDSLLPPPVAAPDVYDRETSGCIYRVGPHEVAGPFRVDSGHGAFSITMQVKALDAVNHERAAV